LYWTKELASLIRLPPDQRGCSILSYSTQAKEDLQGIYEYIAYELYEPDTAAEQVRAIMDEIGDLDEMPMKYRQYDAEPWRPKVCAYFRLGSM
jgi:plasmid stabilization system protein ParE